MKRFDNDILFTGTAHINSYYRQLFYRVTVDIYFATSTFDVPRKFWNNNCLYRDMRKLLKINQRYVEYY